MDAPGAGRGDEVDLQDKMIRANVIAALRRVGGHEYDLIRTPRDLNGQPSGPPAQAGRLFGYAYLKASDSHNLHIDLPGVITTDNNGPAMTAVLLCGEEPREGDTVSCDGRQTDVVKAYRAGVVWAMALKELI
jgi:hypothetical protein